MSPAKQAIDVWLTALDKLLNTACVTAGNCDDLRLIAFCRILLILSLSPYILSTKTTSTTT